MKKADIKESRWKFYFRRTQDNLGATILILGIIYMFFTGGAQVMVLGIGIMVFEIHQSILHRN